jgi:AraC-like DNA-binding protein
MNFQSITPNKDISLFVKDILIFESSDAAVKTCLPFFADGYPGLMFQQTTSGLIVNPHQKLMPTLFLYGQTLKPIELEMNGTYRIIVFQLYPFLLKGFFNITPDSINDNCYDLGEVKEFDIGALLATLLSFADTSQRVDCLSHFLLQLFILKKQNLDYKILQVIKSIIKEKGTENIINIAKSHHINSRTLERRFFAETGLSPKQFAKVIQFQSSLEQLNYKDFTKLTDIVYGNGFSDQSHFIKVFKAYTGKTPNAFIRQ